LHIIRKNEKRGIDQMKNGELFSFENTIAREVCEVVSYPFEIPEVLSEFIMRLGRRLDPKKFNRIGSSIWAAKSAKIAPSATVLGPAIIDELAEIRPGAYIRGGVIVGKGCVVGNSSEVKSSLLFDGVQIPHFNYVGDSVLGWRAHLGAGAIISNLKSDKSDVVMQFGRQKVDTYRRKCGAAVGDLAEIGCNSVLCPGAVIGKGATVYPLVRVRGYIPDDSILKGDGAIIKKEQRTDG
jgi:NDP-sugar pyrophosphorylase family protein